jgi:para-nitrobenzyl esterase
MIRPFQMLVLSALAPFGVAHAQQSVTVQTQQGAVVGRQAEVRTFLGIPYAAPPVGELRWQPPRPAAPWNTPRDASRSGGKCPQTVLALFARPGEAPGTVQGQEDCLYLNVYAPNGATAQSKLHVMVWIHGGAFTAGATDAYDGSVLAQKNNLVVVTVNYRLGALGWLSLPALGAEAGSGQSGNYGLLDQQAALRWVQSNITAFGGDPAKVTIAGESAGGMSNCAHLASPASAGLFRGVIIQSGLCTSPGNSVTMADAHSRNQKYAANLGCKADDLGCLRAVPVEKLLQTRVPGLRPAANLVWSPVYASSLLPLTLRDAYGTGQFNRVPVMNGTTHDEGRLFVSVASPDGKPISPLVYWGGTGLTVGAANTVKVLRQYPYRNFGTPALAFATMFTDAVFSCPALRVDAGLSKYVPVYAFEFNDPNAATIVRSPADLPGLGAHHSSSLAYAFQSKVDGLADPADFTPAQRQLSEAFSAAWVSFIKTGKPASADWQTFDPAQRNVQIFTPDGVRPSLLFSNDHRCNFWLPLDLQ